MLKCPNHGCGYEGPFDVLVEHSIRLHSDGETYDEFDDGISWDKYSNTCCPKCYYEGPLKDFENE